MHRLLELEEATPRECYMVDMMLANVCKHNVTRFPSRYRAAAGHRGRPGGDHALAGLREPRVASYLEIPQGLGGHTHRHIKILKFIENMTMGCRRRPTLPGIRREFTRRSGS